MSELVIKRPTEPVIRQESISDIMARVIQCESKGRHEGVWGDYGLAYGKWQFHEDTFYWLADLAGYKNVDWKSEHDQDLVGRWAFNNGYGYLWSCY